MHYTNTWRYSTLLMKKILHKLDGRKDVNIVSTRYHNALSLLLDRYVIGDIP
jgi:hypothetical protein